MSSVILGCVITITVITGVSSNEIWEPSNRDETQFQLGYQYAIMSHWILADAKIKLRQATNVKKTYEKMLSYELGTIAASIYDKFKHMLETYRYYSSITDHRRNRFYVEEIFNAYHVIKGDFNEIRMELNLYYEIVKKHDKKLDRYNKVKDVILDIFGLAGMHRTPVERMGDNKMPKSLKNGGAIDKQKEIEEEEEYKRSLRIKKWAEKWNNFIPEVEGVDIDEAAKPRL